MQVTGCGRWVFHDGGDAGRVLSMTLLAALLYTAFAALVWATGDSSEGGGDLPPFSLTDNLMLGAVASLLFGLLTPLPVAFSVVLYVHLRVRREGFDIEWMARGAGLIDVPVRAVSPAESAAVPNEGRRE